jgi:Ca-activated chloride channel family protein
LLSVIGLAVGTVLSAQDPPRQVFRSGASAVAVDVSVRDRSRRPVTGLDADDFQVYDNGVLQRVDTVSYGKVPIDVTIALDVSYSVTGELLDRLRQGVVQLMRDLGPDDRLRLLLFNMRVTRVTPFTRDVRLVESVLRSAKAGGGTALLDAISVALVSAVASDRRQLVVFFTDGDDSSSTTTADTLVAVAQRTRATLTFVVPGGVTGPVVFSGNRPGAQVPLPTVTRLTTPPRNALLARLTIETGGTVLPAGPSGNLSATFRQVLTEFRSAYVLYYTPRGVPADGYHELQVKTSREQATILARRGYFGS